MGGLSEEAVVTRTQALDVNGLHRSVVAGLSF